MSKFQNMYETYLKFNEKTFLLGDSTPKSLTNQETEGLIEQFLYTYSYLGLTSDEFLSIKELKQLLFDKITSIKNYASLSNEQLWWGISLLYFKIATTYHKIYFLDGVIDTLLDKLHDLSKEDLTFYCNTLNDTCGMLIGYDLRIRPSCDENKKAYISDIQFKTIQHKAEIINILKQNFTLRDVTSDEVFREQIIINSFNVLQDPWMSVFDILSGQILAITDSALSNLVIKDDLASAVEIALLDLLSNSERIPDNISKISEDIAELIK